MKTWFLLDSMDYDATIQSIAYAFLDEVEYKPRTAEEEEEEEFDFYVWWEETDKYDLLVSIVDSYATGSWRMHMEIILEATSAPDDVDSGLWVATSEWTKVVGCIAFELLRIDAFSWIEEHVKNNNPAFESGGVLPQSNDRQIWLGKDAPLFIIEVENPTDMFKSVDVLVEEHPNLLRLDFWVGQLCFEGTTEHVEPRDLKELILGGRLAIRPRRLYTQGSTRSSGTPPTPREALSLALAKSWVTIPDYEHYKTVLPQLSVD